MSWSSAMIGDAGGASALAAALVRTSHEVISHSRALRTSYADLRDSWVGPAAIGAMRRAEVMATALEHSATAMATVADVLQRQAVERAEVTRAQRELAQRAQTLGWVVTDFGAEPAPGIRGLATADQAARDEDIRRELTAEAARLRTRGENLAHELASTLDPSELASLALRVRNS